MNKTNETRNNISIFEYEYIDDEEKIPVMEVSEIQVSKTQETKSVS